MNTYVPRALALVCTLALASPALAQNAPDERVSGIKLRRVRAKGSGKVRIDKQLPSGFPLPPEARREVEALRLKRRVNGKLTGKVVAGQRVHAKRLAKLARIRNLAAAKGNKEVVARVDKLTARENARFDVWLSKAASE